MNKNKLAIIITILILLSIIGCFIAFNHIGIKINNEKQNKTVEYMEVGIDKNNTNIGYEILKYEFAEYFTDDSNTKLSWRINYNFDEQEKEKKYVIGLKDNEWMILLFDEEYSDYTQKVFETRHNESDSGDIYVNIKGVESKQNIDIEYRIFKEIDNEKETTEETIKEGVLQKEIKKIEILGIN